MEVMARRLFVVVAVCAVMTLPVLGMRQDLLKTDATRMEQKLTAIIGRGAAAPKNPKPLRTSFTDREVNAYFKHSADMPTGVVDPRLTIEDGGRVQARATIDLAAVAKAKPRTFFDPLAWLSGSLEVVAVGRVKAADGQGTLQIDQATLGGVTIPQAVLQEIVSHYTKTPESPNGFTLDKPFALPVKIRAVETKRGLATVVQ